MSFLAEEESVGGPLSCFYISPFQQGRHDGATGMGPTPRSQELPALQFSLSGSKPEHAHSSTNKVPKIGYLPEKLHSDIDNSRYLQHNHSCIYLLLGQPQYGGLVFRFSEYSIAAFENERGRGKAEAFVHYLDVLLRVQVTLECSRSGRRRDNTNSPAMTRI